MVYLATAVTCGCLWSLTSTVLASSDLGSFSAPAAHVRPRFRYWLPDASVDTDIVVGDLESAYSIGAGGAEFLPFYNYGGSLGVPDVDWSIYGFGTEAYVKLFKRVLQAADKVGFVLDLPFGPNQGQGVPAEIDNPGLQWDLDHHATEIPANGSFSGTIPGWRAGAKLVSVNTAHVLAVSNVSSAASSIFQSSNWTVLVVEHDTMREHTSNVSADGQLELSLPAIPETQNYQLIAIYEFQSLHRACEPGPNPQNYLQNGSFTVDHFSKRGAQVIADFWEKHLLDNETLGLIKRVGNFMWEDSLEVLSNVNWTPDFPAVFNETVGYDIRKFLPLILWGNNNINIQAPSPGTLRVVTNRPNLDMAFIDDYRKVLAKCYGRYLEGLREWSHGLLDMNLSLQVSYNLPADALANVPNVDAPETETIQFGGGTVDSVKQFAGPAFLSGKKILSSEFGGEFGSGYRQSLSHLTFLLNRAFSGGVNQQVIHGQSYSGPYPDTTWPGITPFNFIVAEPWSQRQPCWENGMADFLHYAARASFTQQSGVPKFDVVFYQKDSITDPNFGIQYNHTDLIKAGYTYNYLSPANFYLPQAKVQDGVLARAGPSYKALVVQSKENMTVAGVQKLVEYSEAGLPIIFADGTPPVYAENQNRQSAAVLKTLEDLLARENVFKAIGGQIAKKLAEIGIKPNIAVSGSDSVYTTWRKGADNDTDWAFIYTDLKAATANITVSTTKTPYIFDPWTGSQTALLEYERKGSTLVIPIRLAANQSLVLGFTNQQVSGSTAPKYSVQRLPSNVIGYDISSSGNVTLKVANITVQGGSQVITSTTGSHSLKVPDVPAPFELTDWALTVEHWKPPANISSPNFDSVKSNTTQQVKAPLKPWVSLSGLNNTSGVGYYSANFTWSPSADEGAYLYLDPIKHTARVICNGQATPPLDLTRPKLDITPYLVDGENDITIVVSTTLWNALLPVLPDVYSTGRNLVTVGVIPMGALVQEQEGLIGSVRVVPYKRVLLG